MGMRMGTGLSYTGWGEDGKKFVFIDFSSTAYFSVASLREPSSQ